MAVYDTVIKDGMVVDGARMPRRRCDVAIKDGRIAKLGHIRPSDAARVLDAGGKVVAPGFVDLHTHYDAQVFWDHDGSPMVSDVMHDETCIELAEVLAERNEGFIQMTLAKADGSTLDHLERVAAASGRPLLWNAVIAFDNNFAIHRNQLAWLQACRERGLPIYGQGVTTDAGFTFSFDEWNLFDEVDCWREATTGTVAERLAKLSDPARRPALRENRPWITLGSFESISVVETWSDDTKRYVNEAIGDIAAALKKHPVDALPTSPAPTVCARSFSRCPRTPASRVSAS